MNLVFKFLDPLNPLDTENQTFGCRQNNPGICKSNGIKNVCPFASDDFICKKPSNALKKKYNELSKLNNQ